MIEKQETEEKDIKKIKIKLEIEILREDDADLE